MIHVFTGFSIACLIFTIGLVVDMRRQDAKDAAAWDELMRRLRAGEYDSKDGSK